MPKEKSSRVLKESLSVSSVELGRSVQADLYLPPIDPSKGRVSEGPISESPISESQILEGPISEGLNSKGLNSESLPPGGLSLLLINDGQDLVRLGFADLLDELYGRGVLAPLLCVGIHAGHQRKMEYGTAGIPDYLGRGALAKRYAGFIFDELLPRIKTHCGISGFKEQAFAGFSLGALSAMDIVWNHAHAFTRVGLFSGAFWWRIKDEDDPAYRDETDRIMHRRVREGSYSPGLKFFFECGTDDEREDRNGNGIIDSIDDTLDLIGELVAKGYDPAKDICYLEIDQGRHDMATWAKAWPVFLEWGWGASSAGMKRPSR